MNTKTLENKDGEIMNNISTKIFAIIFALLTGLGGAIHGIYEILQGNKPTEGFALADIGAVSIIPNYMDDRISS